MRKKCISVFINDEGSSVDTRFPVARGFIDVSVEDATQTLLNQQLEQNVRLVKERNAAYKTIDDLRELNRKMALELQQVEVRYKELSNELECLRRIRANCEEKINQIDCIINPF